MDIISIGACIENMILSYTNIFTKTGYRKY